MSAEHATPTDGRLEWMLKEHARQPLEWTPPEMFDLSSVDGRQELERRFETSEVATVRDPINEIADELYELHNPSKKADAEARADFKADIRDQGVAYGKWVLFPWSKELVRYPAEDDHHALRTSRNRDLITAEEQKRLYDARVAVFGLSVGSNVVEKLVMSGIGGELIIGDPDHLAPSNLNRINGGFPEVGTSKISLAARKISEVDPYIKQFHFTDGVTADNLRTLEYNKPDLLIDEVDDLQAKAAMRHFARQHGIPLIMATDVGDTALIDVERYDVKDAEPFNGAIDSLEFERLRGGEVSAAERGGMMVKIVGVQHIAGRPGDSLQQVGVTLPGIPQLGATAGMAGSMAALAGREILLGHNLMSGRYSSPQEIMLAAQGL